MCAVPLPSAATPGPAHPCAEQLSATNQLAWQVQTRSAVAVQSESISVPTAQIVHAVQLPLPGYALKVPTSHAEQLLYSGWMS